MCIRDRIEPTSGLNSYLLGSLSLFLPSRFVLTDGEKNMPVPDEKKVNPKKQSSKYPVFSVLRKLNLRDLLRMNFPRPSFSKNSVRLLSLSPFLYEPLRLHNKQRVTFHASSAKAEELIEELGLGLRSKKLKKVLAQLDPTGEGVVSREDFLNWYTEKMHRGG